MSDEYDQELKNRLPLPPEEKGEELDPLHLGLDDDRLVEVIDQRIESAETHYAAERLEEMQDKLDDYVLGNQLTDIKSIRRQSLPYVENLLFEAQMRNKPIALSRLPDLTAKAGNDTPESKKNAELITDVINSDIKKDLNRAVLGLAYTQRPRGRFSVIKARWNPEIGQSGDYGFENVHFKNILMDHACPTPDPQKMEFIAESAQLNVQKACMMFPDKKEKIIDYMGLNDESDKRSMDMKMATPMTIREVWFHWYEEETEEATGERKWVRIDGVVWKYKRLILGKMRNPYWDWQGQKRYFTLKMTEDKEMNEDDLYEKMFGVTDQSRLYFNNYFDQPQKPYYIMTYFRSGKSPIDETSEYEQIIPFQDAVNAEGRQIFDMNSRTKGKFIFAAQKISKKAVEKLDLHNYNQSITIDSDNAAGAVNILRGDPAPSQLYQSKQMNRSIGFEMLALNATTRGVRDSGDETLGAKQMMREQDFGVIDDMVEEMINPAAKWMARWAMHFIKLFYTKPHMRRILGKDGDTVFAAITQDLIEDGVEIEVSASGVDKVKRQRSAQNDAQMGMIDPLTYFEDMGYTDAKERARKLMEFKLAPQMYLQQTVIGQSPIPPLGQPPPGGPPGLQGQPPPPPGGAPEMEGQQAPPGGPQPPIA